MGNLGGMESEKKGEGSTEGEDEKEGVKKKGKGYQKRETKGGIIKQKGG